MQPLPDRNEPLRNGFSKQMGTISKERTNDCTRMEDGRHPAETTPVKRQQGVPRHAAGQSDNAHLNLHRPCADHWTACSPYPGVALLHAKKG